MSGQYPDMSDYVVHFTREYPGRTPFQNIMSILHSRTIKAENAFGLARDSATPIAEQTCPPTRAEVSDLFGCAGKVLLNRKG